MLIHYRCFVLTTYSTMFHSIFGDLALRYFYKYNTKLAIIRFLLVLNFVGSETSGHPCVCPHCCVPYQWTPFNLILTHIVCGTECLST